MAFVADVMGSTKMNRASVKDCMCVCVCVCVCGLYMQIVSKKRKKRPIAIHIHTFHRAFSICDDGDGEFPLEQVL